MYVDSSVSNKWALLVGVLSDNSKQALIVTVQMLLINRRIPENRWSILKPIFNSSKFVFSRLGENQKKGSNKGERVKKMLNKRGYHFLIAAKLTQLDYLKEKTLQIERENRDIMVIEDYSRD